MKRSGSPRRRTSMWEWVIGIPLVGLFVAGLCIFLYISYFNPRLGLGMRQVRTEVIDKVERTLPDGNLDAPASYLLVRIEGSELKLTAHPHDWASVAKGDTVEVEVAPSTTGGFAVHSWTKVPPEPQ